MRVWSKPFIEVGEDDEKGTPVDKDFGRTRGRRDGAKERRSVEMIGVTVEIREGVLTHRALKIAKEGKTGRRVRLVFPVLQQLVLYKLLQSEAFSVIGGSGQMEAA